MCVNAFLRQLSVPETVANLPQTRGHASLLSSLLCHSFWTGHKHTDEVVILEFPCKLKYYLMSNLNLLNSFPNGGKLFKKNNLLAEVGLFCH